VVNIAGIKNYIQAEASAEELPYGKPHPQVYLDCASMLGSHPLECLCFEDSFNGMIAVKAARMKCVVVPHYESSREEKWAAADLKISSLQNFGELHFNMLNA
jgi:sugar-phosphatase